MAQAVSPRSLTAEARVRFHVSPCEICGRQSGIGTGFRASTSAFPFHYHSSIAALFVCSQYYPYQKNNRANHCTQSIVSDTRGQQCLAKCRNAIVRGFEATNISRISKTGL